MHNTYQATEAQMEGLLAARSMKSMKSVKSLRRPASGLRRPSSKTLPPLKPQPTKNTLDDLDAVAVADDYESDHEATAPRKPLGAFKPAASWVTSLMGHWVRSMKRVRAEAAAAAAFRDAAAAAAAAAGAEHRTRAERLARNGTTGDLDDRIAAFRATRARALELLRSGGVVATHDASAPAPLSKQGDLSLYSYAEQKKRLAVRGHAGFLSLCHDLWALVSFHGELREPAYLEMITRFHAVVIPPPLDAKAVRASAEADWQRDRHGDSLNFAEFCDSLFEAVDVWTESSDAEEYVEILERLVAGACKADGCDLAWRPAGDVWFDAAAFGGGAKPRFASARAIQRVARGFSARLGTSEGAARKKKHAAKKKKHHAKSPVRRFAVAEVDAKIAELFAARVHSLRYLAAHPGTKPPRFDAFVLEHFVREHGSRDAAKRHLKAFLKACDGLLRENADGLSTVDVGDASTPKHARAGLFALASGLTSGAPRNARLAEGFIFPVLAAVFEEDAAMEGLLKRREATDAEKLAAAVSSRLPAAAAPAVADALAPAVAPRARAPDGVDVDLGLYLCAAVFLREERVAAFRRTCAARRLQRAHARLKRSIRQSRPSPRQSRLSPRRALDAARRADARLNPATPTKTPRRAAAVLARARSRPLVSAES